MSKEKKNPNKRIVTEAELRKREAAMQAKIDECNARNDKLAEETNQRIEDLKTEAIQDAELYARSVLYLAAKNVFGFGAVEIEKWQLEADRIGEKIADENGKDKGYSIETVKRELSWIGVIIEGVWK